MAGNKKKSEIHQEVEKKKKEADDASQKALELAKYAEKVKTTFESLQGEATAETAGLVEGAAQAIQGGIEGKYNEAVEKAKEIDEELEEEKECFEEGIKADGNDIGKLNQLRKEASKAGVSEGSIAIAEKSKQEEINFLEKEANEVENAQKEMEAKLNESKQRRNAARFSHKSKNTLGN